MTALKTLAIGALSALSLALVSCEYTPEQCEKDSGVWDSRTNSCTTGGTTPEG